MEVAPCGPSPFARKIRRRELIRESYIADLNVIDFSRLDLAMPEVRHDLPTGAVNLSQRATGYAATIVNGTVLLPGRVLRNERTATSWSDSRSR